MSAPDSIKTLADAMLPDETVMQAACRFLRERDDHEYARSALEQSENQYRREAKDLRAKRDRLKGETRRLKREVRRLSLAVENRNRDLKAVRADAVESAAEKCKWWRDPVMCFVSDLQEHAQQIRNGGTDNE